MLSLNFLLKITELSCFRQMSTKEMESIRLD